MPFHRLRLLGGALRPFGTLAKPSITIMSVLMAAGGMALAREHGFTVRSLVALVGIGCAVGCANALNMILERRVDSLMRRTQHRPLPAGNISLRAATMFAVLVGSGGLALLSWSANTLTVVLSLASIIGYAFVYTPLKRLTPSALFVGAIPGAAPPLLGWTAARGHVDLEGLALFLILLVWQLPHFLAIALRYRDDYARAGIQAISVVYGERATRLQSVVYSTLLVPTCLLLVPLGMAGWIYGFVALLASVSLLIISGRALFSEEHAVWDRRLFAGSLVFLPLLNAALGLDLLWR